MPRQETFDNVRVVKIVDVWSTTDTDLVDEASQFTSTGLMMYWAAVDAAVAFNVKKRDEYLSKRGMFQNPSTRKNTNGGGEKPALKRCKHVQDQQMLQFFKRMKDKKFEQHMTQSRRLPEPKL